NHFRQKSGDQHQPTTQQSSHRNHGYNNDRHGSERRGGGDNHRNNNYSGNNNKLNFKSIRSSSTHKHDSNITALSSPGVPLRATPTRSALRVDADTQESVVELLADKKPGVSGRVFAITEDHATKTSDHVLCISMPMQDSVRITHAYRDLLLQFNDKIRAINAFPLDMCEFDIILDMDWLTEHHAMIDCRSYRVIFGDIHAPEFI
nr:reverse transcriptase domain-containing protein [Tanacetum cinerariifolium]